MKEIIDKIKGWNLQDQFDIAERDEVVKKLTTENSNYAKCKHPKKQQIIIGRQYTKCKLCGFILD